MKAYTTVSKDILCLVWQNSGTTLIMTTMHLIQDIEKFKYIPNQKYYNIFSNLTNIIIDGIDILAHRWIQYKHLM